MSILEDITPAGIVQIYGWQKHIIERWPDGSTFDEKLSNILMTVKDAIERMPKTATEDIVNGEVVHH